MKLSLILVLVFGVLTNALTLPIADAVNTTNAANDQCRVGCIPEYNRCMAPLVRSSLHPSLKISTTKSHK
ncbi:hypothetical protein K504DRAFT_458777 [Pleomassaria siparia CBS 279.74]|uniref:Uncharacterized protein n=1 Tax=Pleomassaria siparia CBS 279.74 TaxID=1314801 RepID=A0A6G1K495_9PLEO|nr:hypothetical protein K504DRAFT_458777 [Pleomassaria siparia CBS 279.74]